MADNICFPAKLMHGHIFDLVARTVDRIFYPWVVFEQKEESAGRHVTGKWSWLVLPMAPSTTHMYFKPYDNALVTPNYFYQKMEYPDVQKNT